MRFSKEQKKALVAYNFAVTQEDRYLGSVFVNPAGQKQYECKRIAAYNHCKSLGMDHSHGL